MVQKIKQQSLPVGILDPQMISATFMQTTKQEAVDYLARAISRFARKEYKMFFHNPGSAPIPRPLCQARFFRMPHVLSLQAIIGYWW